MTLIRFAALGAIAVACLVVMFVDRGSREQPVPEQHPAVSAPAVAIDVPLPLPRPVMPSMAKPILKPAIAAVPEPPPYPCWEVRIGDAMFSRAQLEALAAQHHTTAKQRAAALRCLNH